MLNKIIHDDDIEKRLFKGMQKNGGSDDDPRRSSDKDESQQPAATRKDATDVVTVTAEPEAETTDDKAVVPTDASSGSPSMSSPVATGPMPHVVSVQSTPAAVNWDGKPGADGLAIRLFFWRRDQAKAISLSGGFVEFVMYDGSVGSENIETTPTLKRWIYTADQLSALRAQSAFGFGYALQLPFENNKPTKGSVTLVVRYLSGSQTVAVSKPVVVSAG